MHKTLSSQFLPQKGLNFKRAKADSFFISFYLCAWVLVGFTIASNRFLHWFIIPVLLCGILIGTDAVDWFRGRLNIFDPVGVLGFLGLHFFFLAPLLHVYWDYWLLYVTSPSDWRDWVGSMAVLNFLGLLMYRLSRQHKYEQRPINQTLWQLDRQKFFVIVGIALVTTAFLQVWVYLQYGGVLGYITAYEERLTGEMAFQSMGWLFMISESFPILALIPFAVYAEKKKFARSWIVLAIALLIFLALKILFGGLRGSRSNTIWGLFWAVGIIHFWLRPVSRKFILVGCLFLTMFMYACGFYKGGGLEGLGGALQSAEIRAGLAESRSRGLETTILGDLGRTDIQAFLLYRLSISERDYKYAWGRTYLGAAAMLIPRSAWPDRPPNKVKEGTEAQYGMEAYIPGVRHSSRVYGLAGETMLNFGPVLVPFVFLILGYLVCQVKHLTLDLKPNDSRLLLLPFLVNLCFVVLISDSDNVLFFLIKNGAIPLMVVVLCSKRTGLVQLV